MLRGVENSLKQKIMKTKKYIVSNPLVANATGKTVGKQIKLAAPKLPSTSTGSAGSESQKQKPYTPVKCEMYKLPKCYLPDVKTASGYKNNKVSDILEVFKKYPSLDYVSAYSFSTKDSEVNKAVWKRFLELYDLGYIKRVYDKINGYFENGLQNYVKTHSQAEIDSYFPVNHLRDEIGTIITRNIGFRDNVSYQNDLLDFIKSFISAPETLFQAMYDNSKKQLLTEARSITLKITGVSDKEDGTYFADVKGNRVSLFDQNPALFKLASILDTALLWNGQIYRKTLQTNNKKQLYTVALKDNLIQLQVSTKGVSDGENEELGDFDEGEKDDNSKGARNFSKSNNKSIILGGVAILAGIFLLKRRIMKS